MVIEFFDKEHDSVFVVFLGIAIQLSHVFRHLRVLVGERSYHFIEIFHELSVLLDLSLQTRLFFVEKVQLLLVVFEPLLVCSNFACQRHDCILEVGEDSSCQARVIFHFHRIVTELSMRHNAAASLFQTGASLCGFHL